MPAYLSLIPHAAEGHTHELAAQRPRDGHAERGLADAGRAHEAEDGSLLARVELHYREVLDDALLDLLQVIMVLVEDDLGALQIDLCHGWIAATGPVSQSSHVRQRSPPTPGPCGIGG